jgi:NADH dehydrogenase [ubiquinone] 1 alpha subcomplex assembly factor 1
MILKITALKSILILITFYVTINMKKVFIFSSPASAKEWRVLNDGVMGGVSTSELVFNNDGHGQFSGQVFLENNGGFASVQLNKTISLSPENKYIVLRVKGDGKRYEFRLKNSLTKPEAYVHPFETSGDWQEIKLSINDFYPQFRGRKLNMENFNFNSIEQFSFLIANKKQEDFKLLIDWIGIE